jgi:hypothetical protein
MGGAPGVREWLFPGTGRETALEVEPILMPSLLKNPID